MSAESNAELYRRWLLEMWNGDLSLVDALIAPDFVMYRAPWGGDPEVRGPEGVRGLVEQGRAPFSNMTFRIEYGPVADGDTVAACWSGTGTYRSGLAGMDAPAGTVFTFGGIDVLRVRNGKFVEYRVSAGTRH